MKHSESYEKFVVIIVSVCLEPQTSPLELKNILKTNVWINAQASLDCSLALLQVNISFSVNTESDINEYNDIKY